MVGVTVVSVGDGKTTTAALPGPQFVPPRLVEVPTSGGRLRLWLTIARPELVLLVTH